VRLAAAGCLRHLCAAVPAVLTPLIDKSVEALETYKSAQEAVSGYSGGLAALLGAVRSVLEVNFLTVLTAVYKTGCASLKIITYYYCTVLAYRDNKITSHIVYGNRFIMHCPFSCTI
jgi:hypothetical protein